MKTLRFFFLLMAFFVLGTKSQLAFAQFAGSDLTSNSDAYLLISGRIIPASCLLNIFNANAVNKNVFQLPPLPYP
jgi:hypothetical protein